MRAVQIREFGEVEQLQIEEIADPSPGPAQVLVDIQATAVNFVDLLVISGKYQFLPTRPFVPGKLPSGIVSAVGQGVTTLKVGDRVLALAEQGGYAEMVAVPASDCFVLPDSLSFVDAASMALAYDTAWFALCERGRAKAGESVLVLGASGAVGLAAVQLAHAYGLQVLAAVRTETQKQQVLAAGANHVIDVSVPDLHESLRERVREVTAGAGADIVLDPLGGNYFDAAVRAVAWRGRVVVIGFASGRIPTLKMNYVMLKNIEVSGVQVSDYRKRTPGEMAHCLAEIFRLHGEGKLRPAPAEAVPLSKVRQALAQVRDRSAAARLILVPGEKQ
ncbi:MAG: NADPH:quinone oxidoreductase family protein [Polaromonas sp.]|nr:NADPH:quinone oxidoreductase family protein [Polaromonas sp.]